MEVTVVAIELGVMAIAEVVVAAYIGAGSGNVSLAVEANGVDKVVVAKAVLDLEIVAMAMEVGGI